MRKNPKRKENINLNNLQNNRQREYFNERAEIWDLDVYHDPAKLEKIILELELKIGEKVLDVGSGTGVMIPYLFSQVKKSGKIVALDFSEKMISISEKKNPPEKFPNVKFIVQDINEFPIENDFDIILCYSCFPHFLNKSLAIKKLIKGLKVGGKLMIAHSQSRKAINNLHKKSKAIVSKDRLPSVKKLSKMIKKAGLKILKTLDNEEMFFIIGKKIINQSR